MIVWYNADEELAALTRKRLKHLLLITIPWICAALCVIVLFLWSGNEWDGDRFRRVPGTTRWEYLLSGRASGSYDDLVQLVIVHDLPAPVYSGVTSPAAPGLANYPAYTAWEKTLPPRITYVNVFGFVIDTGPEQGVDLNNRISLFGRRWDIRVPYRDIVAVLLLVAVLLWLQPSLVRRLRDRREHRQQIRDGLICITCGYDLRATPHRCPECGRTFSQAAHSEL